MGSLDKRRLVHNPTAGPEFRVRTRGSALSQLSHANQLFSTTLALWHLLKQNPPFLSDGGWWSIIPWPHYSSTLIISVTGQSCFFFFNTNESCIFITISLSLFRHFAFHFAYNFKSSLFTISQLANYCIDWWEIFKFLINRVIKYFKEKQIAMNYSSSFSFDYATSSTKWSAVCHVAKRTNRPPRSLFFSLDMTSGFFQFPKSWDVFVRVSAHS